MIQGLVRLDLLSVAVLNPRVGVSTGRRAVLVVCLHKVAHRTVEVHEAQGEVHKAQVAVQKGQVELHKGQTEVHKAQAEVHAAQVEAHNVHVEVHAALCTPTSAICMALPTFSGPSQAAEPRANQVTARPTTV